MAEDCIETAGERGGGDRVQPPAPPAGYIPPRTRPGPPGGARAPRGTTAPGTLRARPAAGRRGRRRAGRAGKCSVGKGGGVPRGMPGGAVPLP